MGAAGGTAEPYIFALSPDSAFPLAPDTTVGMGFPIDKSFVVSSLIPAIAAKEYNYIDMWSWVIRYVSGQQPLIRLQTLLCAHFPSYPNSKTLSQHRGKTCLQFGMLIGGVWGGGMDTGGVIGGGGPGGRKPRIREIRSMPSASFIRAQNCRYSQLGQCTWW